MTTAEFDPDSVITGGQAFRDMLSEVQVDTQLKALKAEVLSVKSIAKRDALVKKIKYLAGLKKMEIRPEDAYVLSHVPVVPPMVRPSIQMGNGKIEYADVNMLYKDHMAVNTAFDGIRDIYANDHLSDSRKALYDGAKAIFGVGEAITGNSRADKLKGFVQQISGNTGPKQGFFHSKLLSKKQDFSGRATIYSEPNLSFNEAAVPEEMLWTTYEYHIIRDLVKNGYDYVSAKKSVEKRDNAATASFSKLIKQIPILLNRAPTLMRTNVTAHYPVPIKGKTIGVNPLHLPLYAGDYDGDSFSVHIPVTPEAIEEAKKKLLPQQHIYDYRRGLDSSMVAPGHEAILGSVHLTEPDVTQKTVHFKTEMDALAALKAGTIKENTPISVGA